ncbi:MAG: hypothetical protein A3D28_06180 [Omnitrophica bacterium RIFCSPHIGHO2_02_FULL_63_14]|nr:MAG: hypothetical protein A3D28_06180 [Omnitrophica bacterium RIFCSPHIGHO2_02_FULL_63_14]
MLGWNSRCYWQAMSACWREGVPVSVRGDSQLRKKNSPPVRLAKRIAYPFFMRRFSSCLAVGSRSAEYFAHYGARRVIASPHFVDNERFAAESGKERAAGGIRKSWNIPGDRAVLLFAGKMIDWKRPMDALLALRSLIAGGGRYHLLMAGDGPARKACEAFAARHRLPVTFTGFLNQSCMPGVYATADALVLPSEARETWGLVVNEAMACGVPAVVSDEAGCVPDLIREGETGFSYACGDVAALAAAMRRTAASREISGRMGHEARRHVAAFSAEAAAGGVRKALEAAQRER